jgi:hypothetical protein
MATDAQRARRRAQRETAKAVREFKASKKAHRPTVSRLPKSITQRAREAPTRYAYAVLNGEESRPAKGTLEGSQLARMASFASQGKADPAFAVFQEYWYHDKDHEPDEADEEYDYIEDDEDEE